MLNIKYQDDLSIVLSGEAGQGIQTIETMLTTLAKKGSYHVFATKEYMSRVRGGCNSTEIRIASAPVTARVGRIDILVALTKEAIPHLRERITDKTLVLGEAGIVGYEGMTDLPLTAIAKEIGNAMYSNTVAVGAVCGILELDRAMCEAGIRELFSRKGAEVQELNVKALGRGFERGLEIGRSVSVEIAPAADALSDIMLTGAEAVSLGAIAGGCDYVCAYPMSPGTTVLTTMADYSKKFDIVVEQVEDEIGVANMAIGAWYAGARALVSTSGGGFALMTEAVSLAGMIETPFVAHIAQRPGPATGLPTKTEQGDLDLAIHAGHGDFLKVVLAPGDLEEGFELGSAAFDIADRFQSPVFVLTDQYYVDSYYTTRPFAVPDRPAARATVITGPDYKRFALGAANGLSPRGIPGQGQGIVCVDSDEHDEGGYITEDAELRKAMVAKRLAKIAAARKAALPPRLYGGEGGYRVLFMGWGSVKRPVIEAMARLGRKDVAYLHFPWVYPLPAGVSDFMSKAESCYAIEGNATGQFADLVEHAVLRRFDGRVLKSDGAQFTVEELTERMSALVGKRGIA